MKKWFINIFCFLTLWIIGWSFLTGFLIQITGEKVYYFLIIEVLISFFNIIWWGTHHNQNEDDNLVLMSLILNLNFPSIILIKFYKRSLIKNKLLSNKTKPDLEKEEAAFLLLPEWEQKRIIKAKKNKAIEKVKRHINNFPEENLDLLMQNYNQFLLAQILRANPKLYDSYEINCRMQQAIGEAILNLDNINAFVKVADQWTSFINANSNPQILLNFLTPLTPEQIYANHKENRVDNIIFVRQKLNLPFEI